MIISADLFGAVNGELSTPFYTQSVVDTEVDWHCNYFWQSYGHLNNLISNSRLCVTWLTYAMTSSWVSIGGFKYRTGFNNQRDS
jgi:hypothetical protein